MAEGIIGLLGKEDGAYFNEYYNITTKGNFEGKSIPNRIHAETLSEKIVSSGESEEAFYKGLETERISKLRKIVLEYRTNRTSLHKDDKILTSWNGIMIAAFAKAYKILKEDRYLQAARKADHFIEEHLSQEDKLFVHYRDGSASGTGHIDDYSFYCFALLELYEATLGIHYLERALKFTKVMLQKFFDQDKGGFYLYAEDAETLIHRPKELYDGAIPSGNSVATYVLLKLAAYTGSTELMQTADKQLKYIAVNTADYPSSHCFSLMAIMLDLYKTKELVCVLPDSTKVKEVRELLSHYFLPNVTVLVKTEGNQAQLSEFAEFTKDYNINQQTSSYYLCENRACKAPVHDLKEIEKLLIKTI